MSGPHPKTRTLISQIRSALQAQGTMTFDELWKALGVSRYRLRTALEWAKRGGVQDIGDRRYRLTNQQSLFEMQQEKARRIEDVSLP